ncbi:protein PAXX [Cinclus cinclus]|uniref:protein PAXX n=1 Tax=Cinclus cinclus TaxID=127875 RepID=UPI002E0DA384
MDVDSGWAVLDALSSSSSLSAAVPAGGARRDAQVGPAALGPASPEAPSHPGLPFSPASLTPASRRAALGHGAAALSLGRGSATLQLPEEPRCPALALAQLPAAEACSQLQALVFGMAGCIESLERRLEAVEMLASSCSREKNAARSQQLFLPDPSPKKSKASGSALPAKRKVPGESLINPGFKSKKAPSGVNFEDS